VIYSGDLFDVLPTLAEASIDACVTDPPYGIGFMGKEWDSFSPAQAAKKQGLRQIDKSEAWRPHDKRIINPNLKGRTVNGAISSSQIEYDRTLQGQRAFQDWTERWAREVFRVLKPGAHLLVCGAPRSFHRMACGVEDAGFEIRDCFSWLYGQGFPKSLNLGDGRGTALKPGWEPIVVARKPFNGSTTANVAEHGTGGLNIDACRIETSDDLNGGAYSDGSERHDGDENWRFKNQGKAGDFRQPEGRWPANVVMDEGAAAILDEQTGELTSGLFNGKRSADKFRNAYGEFKGTDETETYGDSGGASRFYKVVTPQRFLYCAKPSREERDFGCDHLPKRSGGEATDRKDGSAGVNNPRAGAGRTSLLDTSEIVYADVAWVNAVLDQMLPVDTGPSRQKATAGSTIQCSGGFVWSMCWCGSPSTDPFHPAMTSIIETKTSCTTPSTTLNSSRRPHTNGCMAAAFGVKAAGGNLAAYAEFRSPWMPITGISQDKAGLSTDDVNLATSVALWLQSKPVGGGNRVGGSRNFHPT